MPDTKVLFAVRSYAVKCIVKGGNIDAIGEAYACLDFGCISDAKRRLACDRKGEEHILAVTSCIGM